MSIERAKRVAGKAAADLLNDGITVGLGTGTTAAYFIEALAVRFQTGLLLHAVVSSSKQSFQLAQELGLPVKDINQAPHIDVTVDGADEIDAQKRMIKGGGGAHVREKILASASQEMIVIVDETKIVSQLGTAKLPVEILWYGAPATRAKLEALGYHGSWRTDQDHTLFITENGNLLYDIAFPSPPKFPEQDHDQIIKVPGVLDTGFFFNLAGRVIIGYLDGRAEIR